MIGKPAQRRRTGTRSDDTASRASLQLRLELAHQRIQQLLERNQHRVRWDAMDAAENIAAAVASAEGDFEPLRPLIDRLSE
jgi:hypothetical protein